nr:hypothetical protein CFP56_57008 [Quercus suber]
MSSNYVLTKFSMIVCSLLAVSDSLNVKLRGSAVDVRKNMFLYSDISERLTVRAKTNVCSRSTVEVIARHLEGQRPVSGRDTSVAIFHYETDVNSIVSNWKRSAENVVVQLAPATTAPREPAHNYQISYDEMIADAIDMYTSFIDIQVVFDKTRGFPSLRFPSGVRVRCVFSGLSTKRTSSYISYSIEHQYKIITLEIGEEDVPA